MKILIPLTILVISFIIYFFFTTPVGPKVKTATPIDTSKLELIQPTQDTHNDYIPSLATIETIPKIKKPLAKEKREYLTLEDLKKGPHQQNVTKTTKKVGSTQQYKMMIFQQLKLLLQQSSSTYYARNHIVLNSTISRILPSQDARETFKSKLSSAFGLDSATIEEQMQQNRTVWDWVIFLAP